MTANKALLAEDGPTLYKAADTAGVDIYFEAAVAGAIPIVRPVRESLAGDHVRRVLGIVNGTTNYVLDQMASTGTRLDDAVKQAQDARLRRGGPHGRRRGLRRRGEGRDPRRASRSTPASRSTTSPARASRASRPTTSPGPRGPATSSSCSPSPSPSATTARTASRCACTPRSCRSTHPLAGVQGAFNAVFVEADAAGQLMFYGQGAGGPPTASAVLGDVVSAARHRVLGGKGPRGVHLRGPARSCRPARRGHALPGPPRSSPTSGRPRPGRRRSWRRTACRSRPSASRRSPPCPGDGAGTTRRPASPTCSSPPTPPVRRALHLRRCASERGPRDHVRPRVEAEPCPVS